MRTKTVLLRTIGLQWVSLYALHIFEYLKSILFLYREKEDKLKKREKMNSGLWILSGISNKPAQSYNGLLVYSQARIHIPKTTGTWNTKKQIKGSWHMFSHFSSLTCWEGKISLPLILSQKRFSSLILMSLVTKMFLRKRYKRIEEVSAKISECNLQKKVSDITDLNIKWFSMWICLFRLIFHSIHTMITKLQQKFVEQLLLYSV